MITNAILLVLYVIVAVLLSPLGFFSNVTLSSDVLASLAKIHDYFVSLNMVIPVNVILGAFGLLLAVELAIFTYKGIMWLIKKIPTIN